MQEYVVHLNDGGCNVTTIARDGRNVSVADRHSWDVFLPDMPRTADDIASLCDDMIEKLAEYVPGGMAGHLVIPASWCFWQTVSLATDRWNDDAALFQFEQFVPVELERLTCTVTRTGPREAMVVALFTDPLGSLLSELETHGYVFTAVTADSDCLHHSTLSDQSGDAEPVLLVVRKGVTVSQAGGGQARHVRLPSNGETAIESLLRTRWQLDALNGADVAAEQCFVFLTEDASNQRLLSVFDAMDVRVEEHGANEAREALALAAVQQSGLRDFRRGALAFGGRWESVKRRATRCAVAGTIFFAVLAGYFHLDTQRYSKADEALRAQAGTIYRQATASQVIPPAAALRLRSERIKLEGLTDTGDAGPEANASGLASLELLHLITANVPPKVKLHVDEVLLDESGVRLSGQTTSHQAAGEIVQRLNSVPDLAVEPPRTKLRPDKTVDFRLHAQRSDRDDR